jgi:hypothetical protein
MLTALGEVAHGCAYRLALSGVVPTFALRLGSELSAYPRFVAACTAFSVRSAASTGYCEGREACLGSPSSPRPFSALQSWTSSRSWTLFLNSSAWPVAAVCALP